MTGIWSGLSGDMYLHLTIQKLSGERSGVESEAWFPFKLNRLRCVKENRKKRKRLCWQAANHGCHCFDRAFLLAGACVCCVKFSRIKRKRQPMGMLGRSSGNHDWLLANACLCFLRFSFTKCTQRKWLRLNGNRAWGTKSPRSWSTFVQHMLNVSIFMQMRMQMFNVQSKNRHDSHEVSLVYCTNQNRLMGKKRKPLNIPVS